MDEAKATAPARIASSARADVSLTTRRRTAQKANPTFRPNPVTIAAMQEARQRRGLPRFASMQALFDDLHADD